MLRLLLCLLLSLGLHALCAGLLRESLAQAGEAHAQALPQVVQLISLAPLAASPALTSAGAKPRVTVPAAIPAPVPPALAPSKLRRPPKPLPAAARQALEPAKAAAPAGSVVNARSSSPPAAVAPTLPAEGRAPAVATPQAVKPEVLSLKPSFAQAPPAPRYPTQARRRNQQGVVLLEVRLDARGEQRELRLLRSSGVPSLDQAALTAVAGWRFRAEVRDGHGVPSRVQIPIEFALTATR
jgi:protein TonB